MCACNMKTIQQTLCEISSGKAFAELIRNQLKSIEWLFSSLTFFRQKGQRSKVIQQKIDGEFSRLVSSTTEKNQTANRVGYNKT